MTAYQSSDGIFWVDDGNHLLIVREFGGSVLSVNGAEAVLWRWLNQGYAWTDIRDFYSALIQVPASEGETQVKGIVHRWIEAGLLEDAVG